MTPRDRVIRTLNHQSLDRAPRDLSPLADLETDRAEEMAEIGVRFPVDMLHLDARTLAGKRVKGAPQRGGQATDPWGCTWEVGPRGTIGPLVESPLAGENSVANYEPPADVLDAARFPRAGRACEGELRFVLAWSEVRPLDRLRWLRGPETAAAELSAGNKELRGLLAKLHEVFRREMAHWAATAVDGVALRDGLGAASGLRVSPKTWRNVLKPLYRDYCEILHAADKFVFFQSEGQIAEIFGDLVEVGFDAVHAQWPLVPFEKLAEQYRGRITFWSETELERDGAARSVQDVREAVLRVRRALDFGCGGVIARCLWSPGTPIRNVVAFFEQWMTPLPVNA